MRPSWKRRAFALGTLLLLPICAPKASANGFFARDVVYVAPSDYVTTLATSWYVPTVSVLPTYYATSYVPRSYVSTSYVVRPTSLSYVPTVYRESYAVLPRFPLRPFRRGFLPTAYVYTSSPSVETVYVSPTTFQDTAVETTSACCAPEPVCETPCQPDPCGVASSDTVVTEPARTETVKTVPQGTPPRRVESSPAEAPIIPSTVLAAPKKPTPPPTPAPEATKPKPAETGTGAGTGGTGADPDTASPPAVPAPEVETPSQTPLTNPSDLKPPPAPTGTEPPVELPPKDKAADGTVYQRDARKPVLTAANASAYMRSSREGTLHWLEGKVVSSATNEAESGVRVVVANRRQTFADRVAVTDSNGHYKVRLPDGDWTVSVTTKSGKVYAVSELVVDKGQITDDAGESVPTLTITR